LVLADDLAGEELAQFNMSLILGSSSVQSEECPFTFPKSGDEIRHVYKEID
jgi:hypothetical protein